MTIRYIADYHLNHANIISFDGRPYDSVKDMNVALTKNWNSVVKDNDLTYILGDFCWSKNNHTWIDHLNRLNGQKYLIMGNHDLKSMSRELKHKFVGISDYSEVKEGRRTVLLSHYPITFYRQSHLLDVYMLCGHVHNTNENRYLEFMIDMFRDCSGPYEQEVGTNQGNIYNTGCMMPWMKYAPKTLNEIIEGKEKYKLTKEGLYICTEKEA